LWPFDDYDIFRIDVGSVLPVRTTHVFMPPTDTFNWKTLLYW